MKTFSFYVSKNATRLKKFLLLFKDEKLINNIEFVLIDNMGNEALRDICKTLNIVYYETTLNDTHNKNEFISNMFLNYLEKHNVDNAFIFADRILTGELLIKYKNKLINFHPSLLPSHKGLYAIDKALESKTFLLGNSAHIVTNELDGGCVIMQNIFPAVNFYTYDDVLDKQLLMILQLMQWINTNRFIVKEEMVYIENASYLVAEYIPNIELKGVSYES